MTHLIVIPLYPQFSISTSGSSLRLLEDIFESDPAFNDLKHSVIASWYAYKPSHRDAAYDTLSTLPHRSLLLILR